VPIWQTGAGPRKAITILRHVHVQGNAPLLKVVGARSQLRPLLGSREDREDDRRKDRYDRDHNQQLNQGKTTLAHQVPPIE
jgi:hypothetical protein